ncbi:MAG TPA: endolytic transglycosylase MltG [Candidatus Saccharimonadales bacterium]|nr:endolytic transglycosylase MltG [Candidatus Saccharimonadales bacterium]
MTHYAYHKRRHRIPGRVWWILGGLLVVLVFGVIFVRHIYTTDLKAVSESPKRQIFTVEQGSSVKDIADNLEKAKLIRSAWAFQLYIHSKEISGDLQAGTYALAPNQDVKSIIDTLTKGKVATRLVTILPGQRIDEVKADFINSGFKPTDVDNAFNNLGQYNDLAVMAFRPSGVNTLEGMLWPDSFQKDPTTDPAVIVRESLTEMGQHLTPTVQASFAAEGLNTYQGITLASIIEQEDSSGSLSDQTQVAQVFLSRLKSGSTLGSDVTARYGSIEAGREPSLTYDSPYNTLIHKGLPPTPISTISSNSLYAASHPAKTNWLYFVAGDNGNTYFSTNLKDHQAQADKYCHKLCGE